MVLTINAADMETFLFLRCIELLINPSEPKMYRKELFFFARCTQSLQGHDNNFSTRGIPMLTVQCMLYHFVHLEIRTS